MIRLLSVGFRCTTLDLSIKALYVTNESGAQLHCDMKRLHDLDIIKANDITSQFHYNKLIRRAVVVVMLQNIDLIQATKLHSINRQLSQDFYLPSNTTSLFIPIGYLIAPFSLHLTSDSRMCAIDQPPVGFFVSFLSFGPSPFFIL